MPLITAATITMTMMNVVSADICRAQNFATPGRCHQFANEPELNAERRPAGGWTGQAVLPTYFVSLEGIN